MKKRLGHSYITTGRLICRTAILAIGLLAYAPTQATCTTDLDCGQQAQIKSNAAQIKALRATLALDKRLARQSARLAKQARQIDSLTTEVAK